jgi:hypothetical protein
MYHQRHQAYEVDNAARIISGSIQDMQMQLTTLDIKVNELDMNSITANVGLMEGTDFLRINDYAGTTDVIFQFMENNERKSISIAAIMSRFTEYDKRISELEERLSHYEFYNENAA